MEHSKIYIISARTGCSCCSDENHYRGPYRSKQDAERRIASYKSPDSKYWPLSSQYSSRGNYSIFDVDLEMLPDGRCILDEHYVTDNLKFIDVNEDGTINIDPNNEHFYELE